MIGKFNGHFTIHGWLLCKYNSDKTVIVFICVVYMYIQYNVKITCVFEVWEPHPEAPHIKQGNQRWQIPRPATCQCLATFTSLKSKILIFFRDVISLLARVFILLIDTATQEVPMKNI